MNKKHLIFSIGAVLILSCASALSFSHKDFKEAKADNPTDIGELNFSLDGGSTTWGQGIYLINDSENAVPILDNWQTRFRSEEANSITINGVDIFTTTNKKITIAKFEASKYYVALSDEGYGSRSQGDTIVVKGNWQSTVNGVTYTTYINEFSCTWNGSKWVQNFIAPELEPYDKISLTQFSQDDFDRVAINTEDATTGFNTFTPSADNPHNNFVLEFAFEAYGTMADPLMFRIGGSGAWDTPHFYRLSMCNNQWGSNGKGAILFDEMQNATQIHKSHDIECDLTPGARHIIECGSIVVKNTSKLYHYVKYDGTYLYQEVFTPQTLERTTRVSMFSRTTNIFVGSTTTQKENTDAITFKSSNGASGIYLYGPENNIPYPDNWTSRGAPASKYNVYRNNQFLYAYKSNEGLPFIKHGINEYYYAFSDHNLTFTTGDVISIGGEFHFYINGSAYTMAIIPFCVEFNGQSFVDLGDLDNYLVEKINDAVEFDFYDDDKIPTLTGIIQTTQTNIVGAGTVKEKWTAYDQGKAQIEEVPMNEEKAQQLLNELKASAINELNTYNDETLYEPAQLAVVQGYINAAIASINEATTLQQVRSILNAAKAQIESVPTRQDVVEQRILALEEGYEQYLAKKDVVTTTDLCVSGDMNFYAINAEQESYGSITGPDSIYGRFVTAEDNEDGNVSFKFLYKSTNPLSNKYGSQVFLRLRGTGSNCYMFNIAKKLNNTTYISMAKFIEDALVDEKLYEVGFVANTEYEIECGSIDLKDFNRVFIYVKLNGNVILKDIVDPINIPHTNTVLFLDCHTADDSEDVITLSPIENGTTKSNNSTSLGRLILNENSSSTSLTATLRNNSLPLETELHPIEKNAFRYNGNEMSAYRAGTIIKKVSANQYTISLKNITVQNGDTITIGGCFAYFDEETLVKSSIKLSETTFTYNSSSNKWSQSAPSLEDAKQEAIDYLNDYVVLSRYSETNQTTVQGILSNYITQINAATSNSEVEQLLTAAINAIDAVPTILGDYKTAAKEELSAYKSPSIYRQAEQDELNNILSEAFLRIDACNDTDSVDYIVLVTKQAIDQLKTAAQYDAEELASEKRAAKTEIETYIGLLELDRYSDENVALIQQLAFKARSDVDAASSIDEIKQIVNAFKQSIKDVKTNDGSIFDGEKYIEKGQNNKKGCGGSIIAGSLFISCFSLVGVSLILVKRKHK